MVQNATLGTKPYHSKNKFASLLLAKPIQSVLTEYSYFYRQFFNCNILLMKVIVLLK